MTTIHDEPKVVNTPGSRATKAQWVVGPTTGAHGDPGELVVQLYVAHNKDRKYLFGSLSTFTRTEQRGYTVEEFLVFGGPRVQLPSERIARFSAAALTDYFQRALAYVRTADVADEVAALFTEAVDVDA